jgi:hypothetical protein
MATLYTTGQLINYNSYGNPTKEGVIKVVDMSGGFPVYRVESEGKMDTVFQQNINHVVEESNGEEA